MIRYKFTLKYKYFLYFWVLAAESTAAVKFIAAALAKNLTLVNDNFLPSSALDLTLKLL